MEIRKYEPADDAGLFGMMRDEGPDWECYYGEEEMEKYKVALNSSVTYTAYDGAVLCGYVRCRDDDSFGVFVHDLLVNKKYRGRGIGKMLMGRICEEYPEAVVYVMSGADGYYEKLGLPREGSIFRVNL